MPGGGWGEAGAQGAQVWGHVGCVCIVGFEGGHDGRSTLSSLVFVVPRLCFSWAAMS
jgi:hypothetical protein